MSCRICIALSLSLLPPGRKKRRGHPLVGNGVHQADLRGRRGVSVVMEIFERSLYIYIGRAGVRGIDQLQHYRLDDKMDKRQARQVSEEQLKVG